MPIYHHFYIEHRTDDGWLVPLSFEPEPWKFDGERHFGLFAWESPGAGWLDLFGRVNSQFPMHEGPPGDRRGSYLLEYLDRYYDYERNVDDLCWIPYSELFIDCWDTDTVTVGKKVPAAVALAFGNGEQPFPTEVLLAAGLSERKLEDLRYRRRIETPVDVTVGRRRHELAKRPTDYEVEVTWRETISEFIGEERASLFKGMRQYGRDEDLRILSMRG